MIQLTHLAAVAEIQVASMSICATQLRNWDGIMMTNLDFNHIPECWGTTMIRLLLVKHYSTSPLPSHVLALLYQ